MTDPPVVRTAPEPVTTEMVAPEAVAPLPKPLSEVPELLEIEEPALAHLQRLMGSWGILADLSFADLLLFVPVRGTDAEKFAILGQMRPSTGPTLHHGDLVGHLMESGERPLIGRCWQLGGIVEGEQVLGSGRSQHARIQCIPVRRKGKVVAVISRESPLGVGRRHGELEWEYVGLFDRFARMITEGTFPFLSDEAATEESPRVSDGMIVLDSGARISFLSPNAVNALHRLGLYSNAAGMRLDELGIHQSVVHRVFLTKAPVIEEIERAPDVAVLLRCLPLLRRDKIDGALLLLRDVTALRRRDRLLLSKDAAIRELHHRVKNNLQTISSLLQLQARRLTSEEGRAALREAEVRIRSIAVVHEILSREIGDQVPFNQIVRALLHMAEEAVVAPYPVSLRVKGDAGDLGAGVATPLAVVLSELLQNAVRHAFAPLHADGFEQADGSGGAGYQPAGCGGQPERRGGQPEGLVELVMANDGSHVQVEVRDNGCGLPDGFAIEETTSLGLSIVRDLITKQLRGSIEMRSGEPGTVVEISVPLPEKGPTQIAPAL